MVKFLGKFGIDYCDVLTLLWNVAVFLRGGTININRNYNQPISWIFHMIIIFSAACYFYAYMFSMVWFLLVRYPQTGDFTTAIVELSLTMCSLTSIPKFFYMKLYYNTVMDLVEEYLRCDKLVVKATRFATNFLNNLRIIKKRATTVWIVLVMNALTYVTLPFFLPGRHFCEDLYIIYGLEPMFESPNYEIALVITTAGVYFSVFMVVHITLFIIVIIGCIEAQTLALSEELSNIWNDSEKFYNNLKFYKRHILKDKVRNIFIEIRFTEDSQQFYNKYEHIYTNLRNDQVKNMFVKSRLKDIAKFHIITLNLRRKVDKELSVVFIMEFLFMILAVVTELMGGLENTYLQVSFTGGQAFIICFIGQKLIDASLIFEKTLYSCGWENFDVSNQKTILLMLQCSQRPMTLSAGGVAVLSLPYFMSILKSTYSAYTTLNSSVNLSA